MLTYQLFVSDESRLDILEAHTWYEQKLSGLGKQFEICLDKGFATIQKNPLHFQIRYRNLRIYFIEKFPYGIHYLIEGNKIKVVGVFHTSQSPRNWGYRVRPN